jgi:16S rRNA (cytosine967-C5)-methyltransferase
LLELVDAQVLAIDKDAQRLEKIHANLQRLGLQAQVLQGDAANPPSWWDGVLFDGILLDAPCTASGIVRRHPDVRWLRREEDIAQLAHSQAQMLRALWPLLRRGGRMVFCTCSIFQSEGQEQVQGFLRMHADARALPAPGHLLPGGGAQGLYDNLGHDHDGFFYALLEKRLA